jgi:hypothetical protein
MSLLSSGHAPTIVDLPDTIQVLAEARREAHRTTLKGPPTCSAPRKSTAAASCTPNKRSAAPDLGPPRQLKRVGASPHPPPHTTPRTHHLEAHRGLATPADGLAKDPGLAVGGAIAPPSHSKNLTFVCRRRNHSYITSADSKPLETQPPPLPRSDWDIDPGYNSLCPVGLNRRPEPLHPLPVGLDQPWQHNLPRAGNHHHCRHHYH